MSLNVVLPIDSTVFNLAKVMNKDLAQEFKFAMIWSSTKFPGQQVGSHTLQDGDAIEIYTK